MTDFELAVRASCLVASTAFQVQDRALPDRDRVMAVLSAFLTALPSDARVRDIAPHVIEARRLRPVDEVSRCA